MCDSYEFNCDDIKQHIDRHEAIEMSKEMNTSCKKARTLVEVMSLFGVSRVVACPGSRNTPLLIALDRCKDIATQMVTDERVAAFVGLGMALRSNEVVGLVCTSGTALLNMAPAVAEAYYRKVPLVIISADRPSEWIDQDDSQTIRQRDCLSNIVKRSYDLPATERDADLWLANRTINDALITATSAPCGPVHLNIQIDEPTGGLESSIGTYSERIISVSSANDVPSDALTSELVEKLAGKKVLVIAGFGSPSPRLNEAMNRMSRIGNVAVLTESLANLHGQYFVNEIDASLACLSKEAQPIYNPDVVITTGGALVSRMIKEYLRRLPNGVEHWHVGHCNTTVDCFRRLSLRVEIDPAGFFDRVSKRLERAERSSNSIDEVWHYSAHWLRLRDAARSWLQSYSARSPWSDLKAFATFIPMIPRGADVHFSNGTPVRYGQLFASRTFHRCDCNRGVSGIDGSTSTALGAQIVAADRPTVLITGDMSAQYDMGALASGLMTPRFKMIVICNGGGGIFHFIKSTRELDIVPRCFDAPCIFPASELAKAFGMSFFTACSEEELKEVFKPFINENERPAMLAIHTDGEMSGRVLREFFASAHKI